MEPAVLAGDRIVVTKQIPGPRVYQNIRQIRVDGKVMTKRFRGIRKVRRNDVLVFNFPYSSGSVRGKIDMDLSVFYLKRCVALPGDTFSIESGIYRARSSRESGNHASTRTNRMQDMSTSPDSLGCLFRQRELSLMSRDDFSDGVWYCFPKDAGHYSWNIRDFGPLYVPSSGATLAIDTVNAVLYKNLIEYETNKRLSVRDGAVFLGDDAIEAYAFKLNYYFMAGDNVFDSKDSRYWGLLPEDCIIGKAVLVWRSTDRVTGKIRWNRLFKKIR
jgi:signal peptidase I